MKVLVIDTETTGLDYHKNDIIEFYGLAVNDSDCSSLHLYLKTNQDSTDQAIEKHHLSKSKLDELATEDRQESLRRIVNFMISHNDSLLIGQNLSFDLSMLISNVSRYEALQDDIESLKAFDSFDTMYADKMLRPNRQGKHDLATLAEEYCTKIKPDHSAKNDVFATWQIAMIQISKMNKNAGKKLSNQELNDNVRKFVLTDQKSLNKWLSSKDIETRPVGWPFYEDI